MSKTATGKRILAVLLSLAMLATLCSVVLPLRAGASARETASSVLLGKGQPTTWQNGQPMGAQAFGLTERQDLTGYTHLEFDFYVEDLAAMKRLEGFGELHARVYFTTDAENFLDYGLGTQVIRSGWNHVALNISSGTPVGTVDLTSAKELRIFVDTLPVATQDFRVEVKNIYATKGMQDDAKAMESKLVWNGLEKVWVYDNGGNNRDYGTIWQYEGNAGAPETGADLSGYTHLEFDYTVGDLWDVRGDEKFADICLRLYTGDQFWHISLSDQILKTGVNHVKVSLDGAPDNISLANITNIQVYVETTTDTWGVSVVKDMPIAAENFYATKNSNTETVEAKYITAGNASKTWAAGNHSGYADTHFGNSPDQFDMSGYDFIEFDYYIDDLEAVKAKGLTGAQIKFYFSGWNPDGSFNWGTAMAYSFGDQLKQSGWNHIKLAMSAGTVLEPSEQYPADWTKVSRAWCVLDPYEGITLDKDVVVAVNNLTVTREVLPSEEGAAAITSGGLQSYAAGAQNLIQQAYTFTDTDNKNAAGATHIAFDYYVSDLETLRSQEGFDAVFRLSSNFKADDPEQNPENYFLIGSFVNQLISEGWNHVVMEIGEGSQLTPRPFFDAADLKGFEAFCYIKQLPQAVTLGVKNLCALTIDTGEDPDPDPEPGEIPEEPDHSGEEGLFIAEGATFTWGPSLNPDDPSLVHAGWVNQIYKLDQPLDISEYPYIQMDYYCSDWESLLAEPNFSSIMLRLYTANLTVEEAEQATDAQGVYKSVGLSAQEVDLEMKENGWATVKFYMGGLGVDTIYLIGNYMEANMTTKPSKDYILGYKNYYAVEETGSEELPEGTALIHKGDTFPRLWGPSRNPDNPGLVNANWANVRYDPFRPVDITGTTDLEFDFYVDDWEALKNNPDFATVNLRLYYTANCSDAEQVTYGISKEDLDKLFAESEDGWVHVKLDIFGHTFNEVYGSMFFMEMNQAMKPTQDYQLQVKNIVVTTDPAVIPPEPPEEGTLLAEGEIFQWGPILGPNVNANWINKNYTLNDGNGMDFSKFTELQLDYMVSDWESLKALPNFGSINIRLITDPSDVNKFVQTGLTVEDLEEQGVKSGWNRLKFPMPEEEVGTVYQIMIFIEDNAKTTPDKNYRMGYVNIYGLETVIVDNTPVAPAVPDQPVRPDKDSVYISDCEGLIAGGTWGPNDLQVDTDAKTEGGASLYNIFHSELGTRGSALRLSIGENMNLTGAKELRFDMYISSVELLKSRTKMAVRLATDSRGNSEYIQWDIDKFGELKDGWNSIVLSFSDISSEDEGFNIADIACFNLFCEEQNLEGEEMLRINVDNIRVFGADGALNGGDSPETGVPVALAPVALAALGLGAAIVFGKRKKTK